MKSSESGKRSGVTIVATSDLHGHIEGIVSECEKNKADVLVIAGDIEPANLYVDKKAWFYQEFYGLLDDLDSKGVEVVAIEGNHDFWLKGNYSVKPHDDKSNGGFEKVVPDNFHLLRDSGVVINGLNFYGTPWVPHINGRWCYEGADWDNSHMYNLMPEKVDVLVTHSPPRIPDSLIDVSLDDEEVYRRKFGSKSLYDEIVRKSPKVNFCGHIHSGSKDRHVVKCDNGNCICYNVSRINEQYRVAYPVNVLEIR